MSNDKKPPMGAVSGGYNPDALDLLKVERRIDLLEKEKAELEAKSKLTPGRSQKLANVNNELGELGWARVAMTEHVRANPHQSEIYEREAAHAKRDAARQEEAMERQRRETAAQSGQSYRDTLRAYVASWKKRAEPDSSPEKSKNAEAGAEPE